MLFLKVTEKLISHTEHEALQAEPCALIADNKGRFLIMTGGNSELFEM
jgi:hypothetical protein